MGVVKLVKRQVFDEIFISLGWTCQKCGYDWKASGRNGPHLCLLRRLWQRIIRRPRGAVSIKKGDTA